MDQVGPSKDQAKTIAGPSGPDITRKMGCENIDDIVSSNKSGVNFCEKSGPEATDSDFNRSVDRETWTAPPELIQNPLRNGTERKH